MTDEETPLTESTEPVGHQLQRAREQRGLSASDVAKAQHLRPAVIQAIEAGDYHQIDSELFLKGYVRAYARHVGLDANSVIASLDRELEPLRQKREQEFEANPLMDIERRKRRKRRFAKVTLLLGLAALAAYLVFVFVLPQTEPAAPTSGPAEEEVQEQPIRDVQEEPVAPEAESMDQPVEPATELPSEVATDQPDRASSDAQVEPEAGAPEPEQETSALEALEEPEAVASEESAETDVTVDRAESAPVVTQSTNPVLENAADPVVAADSGRLQISFTADCWVQVTDATGNRLVNSLQRNGDQIDVTGELPLRVVIGAVDAVDSIRFEGETVDMSGYPAVNNRSEFTLTN